MYWKKRATHLYNTERMVLMLNLGMVFAIWYQVSSFITEDRSFCELTIVFMIAYISVLLVFMRYKNLYQTWRTPTVTVARIAQMLIGVASISALRGAQSDSLHFASPTLTFAVRAVALSHNMSKPIEAFGFQVSGTLH